MDNGSVVINVTSPFQNDEEVMLEQKLKKSQILYQKNKEKKTRVCSKTRSKGEKKGIWSKAWSESKKARMWEKKISTQ